MIAGCYRFGQYAASAATRQAEAARLNVTLMGSGAILTEVIKAAQLLALQGVDATVISVTSWSELTRQAHSNAQDEAAAAGGADSAKRGAQAFVTAQLLRTQGPIVAATDYVRAVPESIRAYLPPGRSYTTLGTDGFGRSDTRAALRKHFSVDAASIERAALHALHAQH